MNMGDSLSRFFAIRNVSNLIECEHGVAVSIKRRAEYLNLHVGEIQPNKKRSKGLVFCGVKYNLVLTF